MPTVHANKKFFSHFAKAPTFRICLEQSILLK